METPASNVTKPFGQSTDESCNEDFQSLTNIINTALSDSLTDKDTESTDLLLKYHDQLEKCRSKFLMSKTAKFWLQYSRMVDLLRHFIKGEITGNWMLHIQSIYKMVHILLHRDIIFT